MTRTLIASFSLLLLSSQSAYAQNNKDNQIQAAATAAEIREDSLDGLLEIAKKMFFLDSVVQRITILANLWKISSQQDGLVTSPLRGTLLFSLEKGKSPEVQFNLTQKGECEIFSKGQEFIHLTNFGGKLSYSLGYWDTQLNKICLTEGMVTKGRLKENPNIGIVTFSKTSTVDFYIDSIAIAREKLDIIIDALYWARIITEKEFRDN